MLCFFITMSASSCWLSLKSVAVVKARRGRRRPDCPPSSSALLACKFAFEHLGATVDASSLRMEV